MCAHRHGKIEVVVHLGLDSHHWLLVTEPLLGVRVGGWHLAAAAVSRRRLTQSASNTAAEWCYRLCWGKWHQQQHFRPKGNNNKLGNNRFRSWRRSQRQLRPRSWQCLAAPGGPCGLAQILFLALFHFSLSEPWRLFHFSLSEPWRPTLIVWVAGTSATSQYFQFSTRFSAKRRRALPD